MSSEWIFDGIEQRRIHESRRDFLAALLKSIPARARFTTALDAGCGIGFFAGFLCTEGFDVTAYDAREENVAEAKLRYPNVKFCIRNAEDANVLKLGNFDLTVCFGLLYHLENPFSAIRNLYALTRQALIIESMIAPNELPIARLLNECEGRDQGVRYVAFIPSESCLVKMLYLAGFP
jgi:2-polyprenyl-3-methyl-5-hydroxy-6-metoxy-1,4-benzoquinol methylase